MKPSRFAERASFAVLEEDASSDVGAAHFSEKETMKGVEFDPKDSRWLYTTRETRRNKQNASFSGEHAEDVRDRMFFFP
jgi:hypothetical protein